mmetsp:Transcript_13985/g.40243  ORF Transcript_13985/g.40243 Transcript_13985/m.40243 type:complete len:211 (-) Transcript_13985:59-691(-)
MASAPPGAARTKEFNKYKLVFVGDVQVGKTSIIGRYVYGVFNDTYQNTVGIDFLSKSIRLEGRAIRLQLWDTAGQERFRSLIPSYIRDASAVMVVYDITRKASFSSVSGWVQNIREQQGPDARIVLVGNKSDLSDSREVQTSEGEDLAKQIGGLFFEVSAKTGGNIDELFSQLVATLPVQVAAQDGAEQQAERHHRLERPREAHSKGCAC